MKEITGKGLSIKVDGNIVDYYINNKLVARTNYFNDKEKQEDKIVIRFNYTWGELKGFAGTTLTEEQYQEVIDYKEETKATIENYFNNIEKAELVELSNSSLALVMDEEQEEIEKLNKSYFNEISENWIKENKQFFNKKEEWKENANGMMVCKTTYTFSKEEVEEVKENKIDKEKQAHYENLHRLAEEMTDVDFEDTTGLSKEFLIDY